MKYIIFLTILLGLFSCHKEEIVEPNKTLTKVYYFSYYTWHKKYNTTGVVLYYDKGWIKKECPINIDEYQINIPNSLDTSTFLKLGDTLGITGTSNITKLKIEVNKIIEQWTVKGSDTLDYLYKNNIIFSQESSDSLLYVIDK